MHAQKIDTLPRLPGDDLNELLRCISRYRWRLGAEGVLRLAVRGFITGAALVAVASVLNWLLDLALPVFTLSALLILPVAAAVAMALGAWPSRLQTAHAVDRRLGLAERVATALEVRSRRHGRFDQLQTQDALRQLRLVQQPWPGHAVGRREQLAALGMVVLAALSLALAGLPRPQLQQAEPTALIEPETTADERSIVPDLLDQRSLDFPAAAEQASDTDLAPRVKQAQAEQDALDKLSQALGQVSASQGAADAMQQGDFSSAKQQLSSLGEEADQLSDAAKKQLARALNQAANSTGTDRQLADRERQAASALTRSNYADQRQALRQLGDQVERSGSRSLPASQLARDIGRLQQQQSSSSSQSGPQGANAAQSGAQAQQAAAAQNGSANGQSANGGDGAEQGGPGVGNGSTDGVGDPTGRLATAGQQVDVPTKLSAGPGVRPPTGSEDQTGANPGMAGRSVIDASQTQQTGQVTPEQNLVPGEQRPVIRGYFR